MPQQCTTYAGYRAHRRNPLTNNVCVVLDADEASLCAEGGRWTTLCDAHSTCISTHNLATATACAADPLSFCDDCRALAEAAIAERANDPTHPRAVLTATVNRLIAEGQPVIVEVTAT